MINYTDSPEHLEESQLKGFFQGWTAPPSPQKLLRLLHGSPFVVLAVDDTNESVVRFVPAVTDGVFAAYISYIEVVPEFRGRGIGSHLMRRMIQRLEHLYMADLVCDPELEAFYRRFGMQPLTGMALRKHERLSTDANSL